MGAIDLRLGLDVPIWRQYLVWWWHLLHGNLGTSYLLNRPVTALLAEYQARTMALYGAGLTLGTMLALAGGLLHGVLLCALAGPGLCRARADALRPAQLLRRHRADGNVRDPSALAACRRRP